MKRGAWRGCVAFAAARPRGRASSFLSVVAVVVAADAAEAAAAAAWERYHA